MILVKEILRGTKEDFRSMILEQKTLAWTGKFRE